MKSFKFKYLLAFAAAWLITGCGDEQSKQPNTQTAHDEHDEHDEHEHEAEAGSNNIKEVELSKIQFNAAGIKLGSYSIKNLSQVVNASGYTKLPPQNQADVSAHMGGIVTAINVIEGQEVKKGQVLALLEDPAFAHLQEDYIATKSNLEYLEKEFERQRVLSEENITSKKMFERTKSDRDMAQAKFASLGRQLAMLNLNKTKVTSVMPLVAPIGGHIAHVNITMGAHAQEGQPLISIVDNTKLHADLMVYEKDLNKVKPGQNITLVLTNQNSVQLRGKVFNVSRSFEGDAKAVAVHGDIENKDESLIAGMYVNALIDVGDQAVQALPAEAIIKADGREYIFILETHDEHDHEGEEGNEHEEAIGMHKHEEHFDEKATNEEDEPEAWHFQRVEVKTGTAQLGYVQVTFLHDVDEHTQIVLSGAYYLQSHLIKSEGGGGHHHH